MASKSARDIFWPFLDFLPGAFAAAPRSGKSSSDFFFRGSPRPGKARSAAKDDLVSLASSSAWRRETRGALGGVGRDLGQSRRRKAAFERARYGDGEGEGRRRGGRMWRDGSSARPFGTRGVAARRRGGLLSERPRASVGTTTRVAESMARPSGARSARRRPRAPRATRTTRRGEVSRGTLATRPGSSRRRSGATSPRSAPRATRGKAPPPAKTPSGSF